MPGYPRCFGTHDRHCRVIAMLPGKKLGGFSDAFDEYKKGKTLT